MAINSERVTVECADQSDSTTGMTSAIEGTVRHRHGLPRTQGQTRSEQAS